MVQIRWKEANENIGGSLEASGTKRKLKTRRLETHNKKQEQTITKNNNTKKNNAQGLNIKKKRKKQPTLKTKPLLCNDVEEVFNHK